MLRQFFLGLLLVLTAITLATGCKPKAPIQTATSSGCFQTPFQSESQFIVEAIASDLAEQIYYATTHRLPEKKYFSVIATEKPGSPPDAPVYDLQINLDEKHAGLKLDVNVNGPIWSPGVYHDLAAALGNGVRLHGISAEVVPNGIWPLDFGGPLGDPVTRGIEAKLPWLNGADNPAASALRAAGLPTGEALDAREAFTRK